MKTIHCCLLFLLAFLLSCSATKPWVAREFNNWDEYNKPAELKKELSVFLIGDTGGPALDGPDPNFELLKSSIQSEDSDIVVIFLGDNIYPDGFETASPERRERSERILAKTLETLEDPRVRGFFLPGNHDWYSGHEGLAAQGQFIQEHSINDSRIHFTPQPGCPGPEVWEIHEKIVLVAMDSQWFLMEESEEIARNAGCEISSREEALAEMKHLGERYHDKYLLLATHHPFYSRGKHGGYYSWERHIFPVTDFHSDLWIPLPGVGSLYPLILSTGFDIQDFSNSVNRRYRHEVLEQFSGHPFLIAASGHDHSLQYIETEGIRQVISGAGTKTSDAIIGGEAGFLLSDYGFAKLCIFENGEVWLEFSSPNAGPGGNPVFRHLIHLHAPGEPLFP